VGLFLYEFHISHW